MQHLEVSNFNNFNQFRWETGKQENINKNLPADKQFLVTRGVPCEKRIKDLQKFHEDNAAEMERDVEDGWVETTNPENQTGQDE